MQAGWCAVNQRAPRGRVHCATACSAARCSHPLWTTCARVRSLGSVHRVARVFIGTANTAGEVGGERGMLRSKRGE